jgi:type II secretory pathway pseudopilin PulG
MCKTAVLKRTGFSRIELLLLVAIIGTSIGIIVPGMQSANDHGFRTQTANNLKQCALAAHNAHDQHRHFPPFWGYCGMINANQQASFFVHLVPYLGSSPLWGILHDDPNYANKAYVIVDAYLAPADYSRINDGGGSVNFAVNLRLWQTAGLNNLSPPTINQYEKEGWPVKVRMPESFVPDGTSNTLLFATKLQVCGSNRTTLINGQPTFTPADPTTGTVTNVATINEPYFGWTHVTLDKQSCPSANFGWQPAPESSVCTANSSLAQSFFRQAIQVAMCDASVRSVSASVSFGTWTMALTPNGGEELPKEWDD